MININMDKKTVNTIRVICAEAIQKANSGHPGLPLGCASMAYILWKEHLRFNPNKPKWINRDRFILSAGHGSMLLYSLLHLFGYNLSMEDIKNFRQLKSKTPGHPEYGHTVGVETTTGPLGQGFANAVGMAIAETKMAEKFNKIDFPVIDHFTYVICGDGDLMEGISSEAASLAGHLKLGKLICLYDDNNITIDGSTDLSFTENVVKKFEALGWDVHCIEDGNDCKEISRVIQIAKENINQPSLIKVKNIIGYGCEKYQGTSKIHGSPIGDEEILKMKKNFGLNEESFFIDKEVYDYLQNIVEEKINHFQKWESLISEYEKDYPGEYEELKRIFNNFVPVEDIKLELKEKKWEINQATRVSGEKALNFLKQYIPQIIGGSADLNESTKTYLKNYGNYQAGQRDGDNIYFGIREHAMAAILNGISLYGGFKVFGSTFLVFSDYLKPAIRLSCLMKQPIIYIFTHDSVNVGEDGPTHQPIEQIMTLRLIPNLNVFRPADELETYYAFLSAFSQKSRPSAILLTRQNLSYIPTSKYCLKGGYIISKEDKNLNLVLIATGSEVQIAMEVKKLLKEKNIDARVVSMPCVEIFEMQDENYKNEVLPQNVEVFSIEAGRTFGWERYTKKSTNSFGIDDFGFSAPAKEVLENIKFTSEYIFKKIYEKIKE